MKALKTALAKQVLADGNARRQLREFMASRANQGATIELRTQSGVLRLRPELVPKAA